jgi:leucyl aminopeptidase
MLNSHINLQFFNEKCSELFQNKQTNTHDLLCILITPEQASSKNFDEYSAIKNLCGNGIDRALAKLQKQGDCIELFTENGPEKVAVYCIDSKDKNVSHKILEDQVNKLSNAAQKINHIVKLLKANNIHIFLSSLTENEKNDFAYQMMFHAYSFTKYKTDHKNNMANVFVCGQGNGFSKLRTLAESSFIMADLANDSPNHLYPAEYARRISELQIEIPDLKITTLNYEEMLKLNMGGICGVGQGSSHLPYAVIMEWNGAKNDKITALVGKGVTFDSGGISLKPGANMDEMKFDMSGSAAVVATMYAIAKNNLPVNVVGIVGLAENMPSGNALRPADIITMMSGKTVEVLNTDAEGRLILADMICYAQKKYNASTIVDIATLTGAIIASFGDEYAGLFSNSDTLAATLIESSNITGQKLWRLPLHKNYAKAVKSQVADLKNISDTYKGAGSITAAEFLQCFVEPNVEWAHLDIAGVDCKKKTSSRFGPFLLYNFITRYYNI